MQDSGQQRCELIALCRIVDSSAVS